MPQSKVNRRGPAKPEMVMTPLIDVTFQLIIFFMLLNNFIADETVEMIVPVLDEPRVHEFSEMTRVVVSVAPRPYGRRERDRDHLAWSGEAQFIQVGNSAREYALDELDLVTADLAQRVAAAPRDEEGNSKLEVVLRADAALFYDAVQPAMVAITGAGINKVHLVSYLPEHGPSTAGSGPP